MRIAILLSGRVCKYKSFLELLENNKRKYDIDLFVSVNDEYDKNIQFYDKFIDDFNYYLKDIYIRKYIVPNNFHNEYLSSNKLHNYIYRSLSMFYNDNNCFNMAVKFADDNNFEYDLYLRTRSDIYNSELKLPFSDYLDNINNNILYCVNPINKFTICLTNKNEQIINNRFHSHANKEDIIHHGKWVTGDISFGNIENMKKYCNCYDYVIQKNNEYNENFFICFEHTITMYLESINIKWNFFEYNYEYCESRNNYEF